MRGLRARWSCYCFGSGDGGGGGEGCTSACGKRLITSLLRLLTSCRLQERAVLAGVEVMLDLL